MNGRIPIYEGEERVGSIAWRGTVASGVWVFLANPAIKDKARRLDLRQRIGFIQEARRDLQEDLYRAESGVYYRGWHGFPGLVGALDECLLAVGLQVGYNEIEWPGKSHTTRFPVDVDVESALALQQETVEEDDAIEQWEYLAFQERHPELEK